MARLSSTLASAASAFAAASSSFNNVISLRCAIDVTPALLEACREALETARGGEVVAEDSFSEDWAPKDDRATPFGCWVDATFPLFRVGWDQLHSHNTGSAA